jgi:hypothetical protein
MAKGPHGDRDRDFHFVMAAAAYHLAHLSARVFSLLTIVRAEDNFSPIERVFAQLMLRDLAWFIPFALLLVDSSFVAGICAARQRHTCCH